MADALRMMTEFGGLEFVDNGSGQMQGGPCPFCGKDKHFYLKPEEGLWDCKRCGTSGNQQTFLSYAHKAYFDATRRGDFERLAQLRGLPVSALKNVGWAYDNTAKRWLLPTRSIRGAVTDLRQWDEATGRLHATAGCNVGLWGLHVLLQKKQAEIWLCEGEWDATALQWVVDEVRADVVVLAVPGAGTFKRSWVEHFAGRRVTLCYDNDLAGTKGELKTYELLKGSTKSIRFLRWPEGKQEGYDVRDFILEQTARNSSGGSGVVRSAASAWVPLQQLRVDVPRPRPLASVDVEASGVVPDASGSTGLADRTSRSRESVLEASRATLGDFQKTGSRWEQTVGVYRNWISMTADLTQAMALMYATVLGAQLEDDPLWIWLVGPPSSGKTMLVSSLAEVPLVDFQSTIKPNTLVSGFQGAHDPSLIPKLIGKTLIIKEGTQLLQLPKQIQDEIFSVLRDAFDGSVHRSYGNNVTRHYVGRFNFFGAVTNIIHGRSDASLGERCLKFQLDPIAQDIRNWTMDAVFAKSNDAAKRDAMLQAAAIRFFARDLPRPEDIYGRVPSWAQPKLKSIAEITTWVRGRVEYETGFGRTENLAYRPAREAPYRMLRQLNKLACLLTHTYEQEELSQETYALVKRTAFDTTIGWHLELVTAIALLEKKGEPVTRAVIAAATGLPMTSVTAWSKELVLKGMLVEHKTGSKSRRESAYTYTLSEELREHWSVVHDSEPASLGAASVKRAVFARRRRRLEEE